MEKFIYGSYIYEYELFKEERKTLSLTVMPDLRICVKSPLAANEERIELFLKRKWFWLQKQLNFFKKYQRKIYEREYVSGESFLYLGRQYKIIVKQSDEERVSLSKGQLLVFSMTEVYDGRNNKKLLDKWYLEKTEKVFAERFELMKERFDYEKMPQLSTRKMQRRWGSFLNNEKVFLNPKLIHASKDCIDYVIAHELCHMKYKKHDADFFKLLSKKYPNWERVKEKLENYHRQ